MSFPSKLLALLLLATAQAANAGDARAACDLVDPPTASQLLGAPIVKHTPNRQFQTINNLEISDCLYWGPDRQLLRVTLVEYKSAADARKEFLAGNSASTVVGDDHSLSAESGLGDQARWFRFISEKRAGFSITSGRRGIVIDIRSSDANIAANLRERTKRVLVSALVKL